MKAFPCKAYLQDKTGVVGISEYSGMELRDYFAAKAMQGFCAEGTMFSTDEGEFQSDACAKAAYEWADAMMKARAK